MREIDSRQATHAASAWRARSAELAERLIGERDHGSSRNVHRDQSSTPFDIILLRPGEGLTFRASEKLVEVQSGLIDLSVEYEVKVVAEASQVLVRRGALDNDLVGRDRFAAAPFLRSETGCHHDLPLFRQRVPR